MNALFRFLNNMDARAWRAIGVSLALFAGVLLIFALGRLGGAELVFDEDDLGAIEAWLESHERNLWAIPIVVLLFTLAGFIGAPQFALIALTVVAFDPVRGSIYAWIATLSAASVMFWLGRFIGADTLKRYGGDTVNRLSRFVGRNGFMASLTVRFVPLAPAVVVNMAAGVSHMRFVSFVAGTGLGSIPKIALVAFAGAGFKQVLEGGALLTVALLLIVAGAWLLIMLIARARLRKQNGIEP